MTLKYEWKVEFSVKASRSIETLEKPNPKIYALALALIKDIALNGPFRSNWPSYGKLSKQRCVPENSHHCHIKDGRPTFVACWRVLDKKIKIVEVYYVGTHESAPYQK
jgi:hypothetical protein